MNLRDHFQRVKYALGKRMKLGQRSYVVKGYFASNFILNDTQHEQHLLILLRRHLPNIDGVFIDVGANLGQTLVKVLTVDATRPYFGFEPLLPCCDELQRFIHINNLSHMRVVPIGLSNENNLVKFYSHGLYDDTASLLGHGGGLETIVQVRVGDDLFDELEIEKIGFIKVDVEGAEWQVFDGLRRTLKRDKPMLAFEVLPNFVGPARVSVSKSEAKANWERLDRLQLVLSDSGYRLNRVHPDGGEEPIEKIDLDDKDGYISNDFTATALSNP